MRVSLIIYHVTRRLPTFEKVTRDTSKKPALSRHTF